MRPRYQPSRIYSSLEIAALALVGLMASTMAVAQEGALPEQPLFGTVKTDGWAFEIYNPATHASIFLPVNITAEERMRRIIERISAAEKEPVEFFALQPKMEVFLFDSKSSTRIDGIESGDFIVPLTPCPAGYCLPPWLLDPAARLASPDSEIEEPNIPIVDAEDFGKYLLPLE